MTEELKASCELSVHALLNQEEDQKDQQELGEVFGQI